MADLDILTLWRAVQNHPDFAGGTIFVRGGDTRTLTDEEAAILIDVIGDRLAEVGNEIISNEGFANEDSL